MCTRLKLVRRSLGFHTPLRFALVLQIVLAQRDSCKKNKFIYFKVYLFWYLFDVKINHIYKRFKFFLCNFSRIDQLNKNSSTFLCKLEFKFSSYFWLYNNIMLFMRSPEPISHCKVNCVFHSCLLLKTFCFRKIPLSLLYI